MRSLLLTLLTSLTVIAPLWAQDRVFTYAYQSGVLAPGQRELEVWTTVRSQRDGFYRAIDNRLEFEMGIAKKLQTAFYLNSKHEAKEVRATAASGNTEITLQSSDSWSFSNEWKLKLSDPVANALGLALYGEFTLASQELELEFKLIFDKKRGSYLHAMNLVSETEFETETEIENGTAKVVTETESKLKIIYGLSRNISSQWNVGVETYCTNQLEKGELEYSSVFLGPAISFTKGPIWINLSVLPQVAGLINPSDEDAGLNLDAEEKLQTRLLFSYVF